MPEKEMMNAKPTSEQTGYATDLLKKLGYDVDDYDFDGMTKDEVSELIDELEDEWWGYYDRD